MLSTMSVSSTPTRAALVELLLMQVDGGIGEATFILHSQVWATYQLPERATMPSVCDTKTRTTAYNETTSI